MDDKIRALERARNWEGLKRAYKRAGKLQELNDLTINLILPLQPIHKAFLWSRQRLQHLDYSFVHMEQGPLERNISCFWRTFHNERDFDGGISSLDDLQFMMVLRSDSRKARLKIRCPICERWITWPQQFRVHAKAKHAPLQPYSLTQR